MRTSWSKENFEIDAPDKNAGAVAVRPGSRSMPRKSCWPTAGRISTTLKKAAIHKDFRPVALEAKAKIDLKQNGPFLQVAQRRRQNSTGSDPTLKDEYVIYTAHWDHLGQHPELPGDQIFNGAVDNASGVAAVLQLAAAFSKLNPAPKRSILFMATTAEEAGLLGAKYYAQNPLYPLEKTVADINIDSMNVWGKSRDVEDIEFRLLHPGRSCWPRPPNGRVGLPFPNSRPEKGSIYRGG